jgi:hypothetical protein
MRSDLLRRCRACAAACACAAAALAAVPLAACERSRVEDSAVERFPRGTQELDFLETLSRQVVVTNGDALHGLIGFADGADLSSTYEGRVEIAKRRGWLPGGWDRPAEESAQVGWMAVAGCRILGIRGGLTMRLTGPTPRYATKELVFMDVLPLRTENQALSGQEFVDYLNRLNRFQRDGRALALAREQETQAGADVIPAGAPNQLLDQSSVEFGLPNNAFSMPQPAAPAPVEEP